MNKYNLLLLLLLLSKLLLSQENEFPQYPNPVKIPVSLSATFAELRANAFHAGVDIRTQGVEGKEVFAVANGYVSRIGVSPFGYGKVLYITHDDGFTSVYAHLSKFNKEISDFVKSKQYENQSFVQNILLDENEFPIGKGDYLGMTGNSGSSGGPHLHYEIRYTDTQEPVNPLFFGLKINDNIKPCINGFAIYPMENSSVNGNDTALYLDVLRNNNSYYIENQTFEVNGDIAFGISVFDQANDANNKNGPYSIELYNGNDLIFNIVSDKYSYNETRYINSLIDYSYYVKNNNRFVRTEIDKFNKLSIYKEKKGVVSVKKGDKLKMKFVVKDYNGNVSTLDFQLVGVKRPDLEPKPVLPRSYYRIFDGEPSDIYLDGFEANIPECAFYRDVCVKTAQIDTVAGIYSDYAYLLGSEEMPLHKRISLKIKVKDGYQTDSTLYVASLNKDSEFVFLGNKMNEGFMEAKTNMLGVYVIAKDSISPTVKALNFKENSSIKDNWSLRFEIDDEDTGVNTYEVLVNGEWVLADYDAKKKLLMYQIDNHIKKGRNTVEVIVTDMVGNKCSYKTTLRR